VLFVLLAIWWEDAGKEGNWIAIVSINGLENLRIAYFGQAAADPAGLSYWLSQEAPPSIAARTRRPVGGVLICRLFRSAIMFANVPHPASKPPRSASGPHALPPLVINVAQTIKIGFVGLDLMPAGPARQSTIHVWVATPQTSDLEQIGDRDKWPGEQAQDCRHCRKAGLRRCMPENGQGGTIVPAWGHSAAFVIAPAAGSVSQTPPTR
jgi:hypothetical protein